MHSCVIWLGSKKMQKQRSTNMQTAGVAVEHISLLKHNIWHHSTSGPKEMSCILPDITKTKAEHCKENVCPACVRYATFGLSMPTSTPCFALPERKPSAPQALVPTTEPPALYQKATHFVPKIPPAKYHNNPPNVPKNPPSDLARMDPHKTNMHQQKDPFYQKTTCLPHVCDTCGPVVYQKANLVAPFQTRDAKMGYLRVSSFATRSTTFRSTITQPFASFLMLQSALL